MRFPSQRPEHLNPSSHFLHFALPRLFAPLVPPSGDGVDSRARLVLESGWGYSHEHRHRLRRTAPVHR
jgi:hypothetical protein